MQLLKADHIKHYFRDRLLLDVGALQINEGDRIGLTGRNGSGKTTLLRILAGELEPEAGTVSRHVECKLIPQLKRTDTTESGGEVTRQYMQEALDMKPGILMADEPTTNLDMAHIEWLEREFGKLKNALVLVSHDRAFLDALCTEIWEVDEGEVHVYKGNYSHYAEQKELEKKQEQLAFEKNEREKRKLREALKLKEEKAERATKKPKNISGSEARIKGVKPYFAKKQKKLQKVAKSMETRLEKLGDVSKAKEYAPLKMDMPQAETFKNRILFRAENFAGVVGKRVLWNSADFHIKGGEKVAIIGPNGSGKTTFVKSVLDGAPGVKISPAVKIGYFSQNLNVLDEERTIMDNVQQTSKQSETTIRTVLARMRFFEEEVHKKVGVLSGGERVKATLAKIFVSDANMLILDEPTNYLDMEAVEALESLLQEYEGTVMFVTHDRRFVERVATKVLEIKDREIMLYGKDDLGDDAEPNDDAEQKRLLIETKITEVLSRLSIAPSEALEEEFRQLLMEKRKLTE